MTEIKAIEIINDTESDMRYTKNEIKSAYIMAISALEKQIPKNATFEYDDEAKCPSCGGFIEDYDVTTIIYCPDCGQKLDWSGNNE